MKKFIFIFKKVPLFIMVSIFFVFLFVMGIVGKFRAYSQEQHDFFKESMIEVVIKGLHEGIMPWDEPKKEEEETSIAVAKPEVEMEEDSYISSEEEAKDKRVSIKNIVDQRKLQSNNTYVYADSMPEGVCSSVLDAVDYGICNSMYLTPEGVTYEKQTSPIFAENMDYYLQTASENDSYFDNALFIGDSRTVGLIDYGDLDDHASFFAKESLSIYDLGTMAVEAKSPSENFGELTIEELLKKKEFKKVYICLGVNELGTGNTLRFYNAYVNLIELIRQYQPKSIIYIQGMMHVTKAYSSTDEIYNNKSIVDKNKAIATLANGHDIFYLDMNETVCDENGDLIEELSTDGVHLLGKNYKIWEDYIKTHVIIRSEADK